MKKNYVPGSESFAGGMFTGRMLSQMAREAGRPVMAVDEPAAIAIVKRLLLEGRAIERAELGLDGDWECNSTVIYDGEFHEYNSYGSSLWATPTLIVYFLDGPSEAYECWLPEGKSDNG